MRKMIGVLLGVVFLTGVSNSQICLAAEVQAETQPEADTTAEHEIHYVALGDSVVTGYGLEGYDESEPSSCYNTNSYVNQIADYLRTQSDQVSMDNLAVNGMLSSDLLSALTNPQDASYETYQETLRDADVVTISIGSNDVLTPFLGVLCNECSCTPFTFPNQVQNWIKIAQGTDKVAANASIQGMIAHMAYLKQELPVNTQMQAGVTDFQQNFGQIITAIRILAPDAKIYVNNIYNAYMDFDIYDGGVHYIDVAGITEDYVTALNAVINEDPSEYTIINAHDILNKGWFVNADIFTFVIDPHPNQTGHDRLAAEAIRLMQQ